MTEKEIISKIEQLRQIKPEKEWVALTKERILGTEPKVKWLGLFDYQLKPILAGALMALIVFGLFSVSQNSLPGDTLYPIKKISEKGQAIFVSKNEEPKVKLEWVNKRLEELKEVALKNQTKKLPTALKETENALAEAAKGLVKSENIAQKEVVEKAKEMIVKKEEIEKTLGVEIGGKEEGNLTKTLAEKLIDDLENRNLTKEQKEVLEKAEEDFENGKYQEALLKVLELSYNNE